MLTRSVLDVKIKEYPTHAASLPVAIIPNCAATRHIKYVQNANSKVEFNRPSLKQWPDIIVNATTDVRKVNTDNISKNELKQWRVGETILLSGKIITARDAAHKKILNINPDVAVVQNMYLSLLHFLCLFPITHFYITYT